MAHIKEPHTFLQSGGQMVEKKIPKWAMVSSHTARRSFATNTYKEGTSEILIMGITGHKSQATFLKYIKLSKSEKADMMAESAFFK